MVYMFYRRNSKPDNLKETGQHELSAEQHIANPQCGLALEQIKSQSKYSAVQSDHGPESKGDSEYAVVQKENKPNQSSNEDTYVTANEEEYDNLNNNMIRKKANDGNVYGMTGQCGEDEYDTMKGAFGSNDKDTNGVYDTNIAINRGSGDQTYDSAYTKQYRKHDCENTYDYSQSS